MDREEVRHSEIQVKHVTGNQPNRAHEACTKGHCRFKVGKGVQRTECQVQLI